MLIYLLCYVSATSHDIIKLRFQREINEYDFAKSSLINFEYFKFIDGPCAISSIHIEFATYEQFKNCILLSEKDFDCPVTFSTPASSIKYLEILAKLKPIYIDSVISTMLENMIKGDYHLSFLIYVFLNFKTLKNYITAPLINYLYVSISRSFTHSNYMGLWIDKNMIFGCNGRSHLKFTCVTSESMIKIDLETPKSIKDTPWASLPFEEYLGLLETVAAQFLVYSQMFINKEEMKLKLEICNYDNKKFIDAQIVNYIVKSNLNFSLAKNFIYLSFRGCTLDSETFKALLSYDNLTDIDLNRCIFSEIAFFNMLNAHSKLNFIKLAAMISIDRIKKPLLLPKTLRGLRLAQIIYSSSLHMLVVPPESIFFNLTLYITEDYNLEKLKILDKLKYLLHLEITLFSVKLNQNRKIVNALNDIFSKLSINAITITVEYGIFRTSWFLFTNLKMLGMLRVSGCVIDSFNLLDIANFRLLIQSSCIAKDFMLGNMHLTKVKSFEFGFLGCKEVFDAIFSKISVSEKIMFDFSQILPILKTTRYNFKSCKKFEIRNITKKNKKNSIDFLENCDFLELTSFSAIECIGLEAIFLILKDCSLKTFKVQNLTESKISYWANFKENPKFRSITTIEIDQPISLNLNELEIILNLKEIRRFTLKSHVLKDKHIKKMENLVKGKNIIESLEFVTEPRKFLLIRN